MASHRAVAWLLLGAAFLLWLAAQTSSDARAELRPAPRRRPPLRPSAYRESDYDRLARLERHLEREAPPGDDGTRAPSRAELARSTGLEPFNVWPEKGAAPRAAAPVQQQPPPAAAAAVARKPCAPGCERHGVCNAELGRCDCAPFMGGADCSRPLFPACAASLGLREVAPAPCVIDTLSQPNAPVSCDCLRECELIGAMGVRECYVTDPRNETMVKWVNSQRNLRGLAPNDEYWEASLRGAEAASVRECGGRGVYAPRMPERGAGKGAPRCMCYPGWSGRRCEASTAQRPLRMCLNGCSKRGKCVRNWCHCDAGYYGVDCSLGAPADGGAAVPLPPPIGAQGAGAPRIYVYELPPRFNSWLHAGEGGWWQDFDLWGEDVIIHRRALRSAYRVTDASQADFFLVPVWVSSAMWQMNWGFRDLLPTGVREVRALAEYLRATWPYFDRKGGADHLWVFGHDQGAWHVRARVPQIAAGIFLSPFGAGPAQRGGHAAGRDIVVPPVLYAGVPLGLINHAGRRPPPGLRTLAFFQGKLNLHIPYEYSFGIRQGLYKAHRNTPGIVIKEGHEADRERYFEYMSGSKFCAAAAGFGFSTRAYEASVAGCVPLVMQDGIEQAFEEILPWGDFALRMNDSLSAIPTLRQTLLAIPEERVKRMRSVLYCVWPRFLWLRHDDGASTPLPGQAALLQYDAFESVIWTLRKRLRRDIGWPSDWADGCRAVRRYFETPPAGAARWEPWRNQPHEPPVGS